MSHFFSRARLVARPRDSELLRSLSRHGAAYRDHALLWKLFPGDGQKRDFVFRSVIGPQGDLSYLIVSHRKPQDDPGLFSVQTKPYLPRLAVGEWVHFDLRANPTVSRRVPGQRSRRHDVLMDAKRQAKGQGDVHDAMHKAAIEWLVDRAPSWGLDIPADETVQKAYQQHRLHPKGKVIEYSSLDYEGNARVVDPLALQRALLDGVGHAKGFGCGLLLVKRLD